MRLNPSPSRFFTKHTELFEAGFDRLRRQFPYVDEALDFIELSLTRAPYSAGEPTQVFEGRAMGIMVTPRTRRYPSLRVLFEIEEPRVVCWHVSAIT
jgi:hypothetical protein